MTPTVLEQRGIDPSQAIMVCKLMRATRADRSASSAAHDLNRQLAGLGADEKTIKVMELLGKDLGSLKTMFVDDARFSLLSAAQRQIIAPLLAVEPLHGRALEELRAQGEHLSVRPPGRRVARDGDHTIPLPPKVTSLLTEHQQSRGLLAQPVHLGKLSGPRLPSSLSNAKSRRDAYDGALVFLQRIQPS
jgi:hypothetical protein